MEEWLEKGKAEISEDGVEEKTPENPESFIPAGEPAAEVNREGFALSGEPAAEVNPEGFALSGEPAADVNSEGFIPSGAFSERRYEAAAPAEPSSDSEDLLTGFSFVSENGEPPAEKSGSAEAAGEPTEGRTEPISGAEGPAAESEGRPSESKGPATESEGQAAESEGQASEGKGPAARQGAYASPYDVYRFNGGTRPEPSWRAQPQAGQPAEPPDGQTQPSWRAQTVAGPYRQPGYAQPAGENPMTQREAFAGNGGYGQGQPAGRAPEFRQEPFTGYGQRPAGGSDGGGFGPGGPSDPSKPSDGPKKKGGTGKKVGAILGIAVLFGLVAALVFFGVTRLMGGILRNANVAESAQNTPEPPKFTIGGNQSDSSSDTPAGRNDLGEKDDSTSALPDTSAAVKNKTDLSIPDVVDLVMPSMVAITNTSLTEYHSLFGRSGQYENVSTGSGIIVGETETDYLIATNAHVIKNSEKLTVTFIDDSVVEGTVSASDNTNDLAIVSVKKESIDKETLPQIRIISIGNSDELRVGETVIAIGNALGYGQSVSRGVVSALNRPVEVDNYVTRELIQTDASINPGNSGGALINLRGELVGINEIKTVDTKVEGVGYAIPMATAKPILENLGTKASRKKVDEENASYIGIHCVTMSNYYVQMGYPAGAYVSDVMKDGPAEAAGIVAGDIITAIDGSEVTSSTQLISYLAYYAAGEKVNFTIRRLNDEESAFETKEIEITLGSKKDADFDEPQGELG